MLPSNFSMACAEAEKETWAGVRIGEMYTRRGVISRRDVLWCGLGTICGQLRSNRCLMLRSRRKSVFPTSSRRPNGNAASESRRYFPDQYRFTHPRLRPLRSTIRVALHFISPIISPEGSIQRPKDALVPFPFPLLDGKVLSQVGMRIINMGMEYGEIFYGPNTCCILDNPVFCS